jgi:serine/threonine protein kinase
MLLRRDPGVVVGDRFEIEWLAAAGGMGRVFRARDRQSGEPVAVKVLLGGQRTNVERFMRETRMQEELSQLSRPHPHSGIVRYIAHGLAPSGEPYLAMEWIDGEDLGSRLVRRRLTLDESLTLTRQAAVALGEAHARGIIHRDLEPKNFCSSSGSASPAPRGRPG